MDTNGFKAVTEIFNKIQELERDIARIDSLLSGPSCMIEIGSTTYVDCRYRNFTQEEIKAILGLKKSTLQVILDEYKKEFAKI
jgi:hypothetical protein